MARISGIAVEIPARVRSRLEPLLAGLRQAVSLASPARACVHVGHLIVTKIEDVVVSAYDMGTWDTPTNGFDCGTFAVQTNGVDFGSF